MRIRRLPVGSLDTNCYVVEEEGELLVIDPGADAPRILAEVERLGGQVRAILLTHGHFDHYLAAGAVEEATGAPVWIGKDDAGLLRDPGWMRPFVHVTTLMPKDVRILSEGDEIAVGSTTFKVVSLPGHSPGSVGFYSPGVLFAGDLLFRDGIGRSDLPGADEEDLLQSLAKVMAYPDDTTVYPGHGPRTTLARERLHNPYLP